MREEINIDHYLFEDNPDRISAETCLKALRESKFRPCSLEFAELAYRFWDNNQKMVQSGYPDEVVGHYQKQAWEITAAQKKYCLAMQAKDDFYISSITSMPRR